MTLDEAIDILTKAGIDSASHDAEELFYEIAGFGRSTMYLMYRVESDYPKLIEAVERRAKHEPLQYIIGKAYFYREKYKVTPDCLIPRFDTEILVDYAVKNLKDGASFIDLCTGSGCIAVSVLANTKNTRAIATDISEETLTLAAENAEYNEVRDRIKFVKSDVMNEVTDGEFDAVLCNPPYVTDKAYTELSPEIYYEPKRAFVGGIDGGDFYRHITPIYKEKIKNGGFIAYEIGYDQAELLRSIAAECGMSCEIIKDYSSNDRVAILRK